MSGSSTSGTSFASPIVISTFIGIIVEGCILYALAKDKITDKGKYAVLFIIFTFVGINTAFMYFNNTIQRNAVDEYFKLSYGDSSSEKLIYDSDFDLPAVNGGDKYQIIPGDLSDFVAGDTVLDDINYSSLRVSGTMLFDEIFLKAYMS